MANADYTYNQVLAGQATYSEANSDGRVSTGVRLIQVRLSQIGYVVTVNGLFGSTTTTAVKAFQYSQALTQSGIVDKQMLTQLDAVYNTVYFKYGVPLSESEWGTEKILSGSFNDVDLLARIIYGENTTDVTDQAGVAIVLKNRSITTGYYLPASSYPNASIWARIVGWSGQYGTAQPSSTNARQPRRGYGGNASTGYVAPGWKNAVELATKLVNGTVISTTGYIVNGTTVSSSKKTISTTNDTKYLNQPAWGLYKNWLSAGHIDSSVQPLSFTTSGTGSNILCKYK